MRKRKVATVKDDQGNTISQSERFAEWVMREPIKPPCTTACPVNADIQSFVSLVAQGRFKDSLEVVRERCTLPASLGRICHHPCEGECRRADVDGSVNIRAVKRFAADICKDEPQNGPTSKTRGKKVAVIGGGPAGLTAAFDLSRSGFDVAVFEKEDACGGAIYYGVPKYRLPKDVLAVDVAAIAATGVEIKTNTEIGKDIGFEDIVKDYDAVLIAIGLTLSRGLPIPGSDADGVLLALPFLREANFNDSATIGKRVVVIGGGNVAFDVARSAKRLGAKDINMCCLECDDEIPAFSWEVEEAREEGIKINSSWGPKEIIVKDGKVAGMTFKRCTRVFDENRMFSPAYDECQLLEIEADNVIIAIGQGADMNGFNGTELEIDQRGRLKWNPATLQTNIANVFACGEVVTGPGAAVAAMKNAHHAAAAIEQYLATGKTPSLSIPVPAAIGRMPEEARATIVRKDKNTVPMMEPDERVKSFIEAEPGFSIETAMYEAARCMNCSRGATLVPDKCVSCLTCVRICPHGAPFIDNRLADFDWEICQSCGICAAECPQLAIDVPFNDDALIREQIDAGVSGITAFGCQYGAPIIQNPLSVATMPEQDVNMVKLMCVSRLDTQHILRAIENGVDGVAVFACPDDKCKHRKDINWPELRANRVRKVLEEAGVGGERVRYMGKQGTPEEYKANMAEFRTKLDELGPNPVAKAPVKECAK